MTTSQGIMLIMFAVAGLWIVWRTDIVERIVSGARSVKTL